MSRGYIKPRDTSVFILSGTLKMESLKTSFNVTEIKLLCQGGVTTEIE